MPTFVDVNGSHIQLLDPKDNTSIFTYYSEFNQRWQGAAAIEVTVLVIIFLAGITGNTLVLVSIIRHKQMHKPTDLMIANLALSDLLLLLTVPLVATTRITVNWVLGEHLCRALPYVQMASGNISVLTLMVISYTRFMMVKHNPGRQISVKHTALAIFIIWIFSFVVWIVIAVYHKVYTIPLYGKHYVFCYLDIRRLHMQAVLTIATFVLTFFLPLVVIAVNNCRIYRIVSASAGRVRHQSNRSVKERRLMRMLVAIVVLFVVSWLPFSVEMGIITSQLGTTSTAFVSCVTLVFANSAVNPVIYGCFSRKYRAAILAVITCSSYKGVRRMSE